MSHTRKLFNHRGESVCTSRNPVSLPGRLCSRPTGLSINMSVLLDAATMGNHTIRVEYLLPIDQVEAYLCSVADSAGLTIQIGAVHEQGEGRLAKERLRIIARRLHRQPGEHDLYATGDDNLPSVLMDANGEVVLGCCRDCGLGEAELDEQPVCTGTLLNRDSLVGADDPQIFVGTIRARPVGADDPELTEHFERLRKEV